MLDKLSKKYNDGLYVVFRVLVGLLFFMHGAQKLFGWFGGKGVSLAGMMGMAGIIELVVGLFVVLGLFTRLAALMGALEMIVAYFMVHAPQGLNPLLNKGELALLYFAAFLVIMLNGAKKLSLDKALLKKEY